MLQANAVLNECYRLKHKLAENVGRQTWLAEDLLTRETVVVKMLGFSEQVHWDALKLFEREAQTQRKLNHPQIPKYRNYFSIKEPTLWLGLVQDYIHGSSLKQLLAQGKRFGERQVRQIAVNVLHILIYLHELSPPVLHRDIKPSNLIWGEDNYIYLVDFGAVQDRATTAGASFTVVGTYGYTPIEQFGGRSVPASDLYALGATLVHLLTGVAPVDLPQKNLKQSTDQVSLTPGFAQWIETLVEPDVKRRFATARQALAALQLALTTTNQAQPETNIATIRDYQPEGTRFQLRKSANELLVKHAVSDNWLIAFLSDNDYMILLNILSIYLGVIISSIMYFNNWLIIFWLGGSLLLMALTLHLLKIQRIKRTYIHFNNNHFDVYSRVIVYSAQVSYIFHKRTSVIANGATSNIQNVFQTIKTFEEGRARYDRRVVVLQTQEWVNEDCFGNGVEECEYHLGEKLSLKEATWLVQEIKNWLGMA